MNMSETHGKPGRDAKLPDDRASAEQRRQLQRDIDDNLRRTYKATLEEEVPDRFHLLLAALRDKDKAP